MDATKLQTVWFSSLINRQTKQLHKLQDVTNYSSIFYQLQPLQQRPEPCFGDGIFHYIQKYNVAHMQNKTEKFLRHNVMLIYGLISKRQRRRLHCTTTVILQNAQRKYKRLVCKIRKNTGQPATRIFSGMFFVKERKEKSMCDVYHVCVGGCICGGRIQALTGDNAYINTEKKILEKSHQQRIWKIIRSYCGAARLCNVIHASSDFLCIFTLLKVT